MQHTSLPPLGRRVRHSLYSPPVINPDRLKNAKALVEKAVKLQRVFSIQGPYPVIRAALWARGWVERRLPRHTPCPAGRSHGNEEEDGEEQDDSNDDNDRLEEDREGEPEDMYDLMSRMVRNETTYFYWTTRRYDIDYRLLRKDQMTNHYAKSATFTTKVGLCVNLRNLQWFDAADPDTFFPRCYRLGAEDEKHAFIEDFRRTACTSLLQYVVERSDRESKHEEQEEENVSSQSSQGHVKCRKTRLVGPGMIDGALHICQELLNSLNHSDIDVPMDTPPSFTEEQWASFLHDFYLVIHGGVVIEGIDVYKERCQDMLTRLLKVCPQLETDGVHNIWIIKPGAKSRGRGIMCLNRLGEILKLVDSDPALIKDSKWVVQKYLERPLLVYGTKFDLRQWFLVTDWNPLTVWFYHECYLRFCSQPYSTQTLDSSVHLCNNSIQKHFQPSQRRHPAVPEDNMWSCSQFQAYLRDQGRGPVWGDLVVPGMQQAVVHALQTTQDLVEGRKSSFELYGADFMLGGDLRPWLLEINASPTMAASTAVTARLCPAVQLDTLKVVLDRSLDPAASTGGFQLIYKQAAVEVPQYVGVNMLVEGAPVRRARPPRHQTINVPLSSTHPYTNPVATVEEVKHSRYWPSPRQHPLANDNKSRKSKNRRSPTGSPKQIEEGGALGNNCTLPALKLPQVTATEGPLTLRSEPKKRVCYLQLSLRSDGLLCLLPTASSSSFSTTCRTLGGGFNLSPTNTHPQSVPEPPTSPPLILQSSLGAPHRALPHTLPMLYGSIPALAVLGLRPNTLKGLNRDLHRQHFPSHFHKQAKGPYKGGCASRGPKSS
ncbi:hypothetical protein UPYG_G00168660 [Umbra pygmaea]|uniref:Tubulin monoglycylase TTLL3-like n=1 Tax=Umbra pygmaea TaxID=75934 RepID=A0ABD0WN54_UMBPY